MTEPTCFADWHRWVMRYLDDQGRPCDQYFATKRAALDCAKRDNLTVVSLTRCP